MTIRNLARGPGLAYRGERMRDNCRLLQSNKCHCRSQRRFVSAQLDSRNRKGATWWAKLDTQRWIWLREG